MPPSTLAILQNLVKKANPRASLVPRAEWHVITYDDAKRSDIGRYFEEGLVVEHLSLRIPESALVVRVKDLTAVGLLASKMPHESYWVLRIERVSRDLPHHRRDFLRVIVEAIRFYESRH